MDIEQLYRERGHLILRRARQILNSESEAHDVLQEVFAWLLQKPNALAGVASVTAFLYSATTNACLNRIRNAKNRTRLLRENPDHAFLNDRGATADDHIVARQLLEDVPELEATAFIYHYFAGMTQDEIAEVMQCSRRKVGRLLDRVHARARERGLQT